jgi:hypothetical protein
MVVSRKKKCFYFAVIITSDGIVRRSSLNRQEMHNIGKDLSNKTTCGDNGKVRLSQFLMRTSNEDG